MSGRRLPTGPATFLLAAILLLALAVRAYGLAFPAYHWDENFGFSNVFYAAHNRGQLWTYVHGSFLQYLILAVWATYLLLSGRPLSTENLLLAFYEERTIFLVLARSLLVLASVLTVFVTYRLGRRAYGQVTGIIAALFLSLAFLHVSESHYARGHVLAAFFIILSVAFSLRLAQAPTVGNYLLAGASAGLATAAQYSAVLVMVPLLAAHVAALWPRRRTLRLQAWLLDRSLLVGVNIAAIVFFLVTPYALLEFGYFSSEIKGFLGEIVVRTWVDPEGQPIWLFYLREHLRHGLGLPLELAALAGLIYALYRHRAADLVLLSFPILFFASISRGENFARYGVLLVPFLALFAARLLVDSAGMVEKRLERPLGAPLLALAAPLLLFPSLLNVLRFNYLLTQPDTRAMASAWIQEELPAGAKITVEGAGVLGPDIPPSDERLAQAMAAVPADSYSRLELEVLRDRLRGQPGYDVREVFRLDQVFVAGRQEETVESAGYYLERGVAYLVTSDWMFRTADQGYSPAFRASLEAAYEPAAVFEPTIPFRFDPYAWRIDYEALAQVRPGTPIVGGPRLVVYRRKRLNEPE